ncbi:MAG: hypothetical protein IJT98_11515 [Prevotella sp.]|nr:hypothetical protein [Prevotella sp.]
MKKKLLFAACALLCAVSASADDFLYSSTAKYKIDGPNVVENGDFHDVDLGGWTNGLAEAVDGTTWGVETKVGPNGENAIKSLAANYDADNGGTSTLVGTWPVSRGFYIISYWVKSPSVLSSTIAGAGSTNYINFFYNADGDNTVTTAYAPLTALTTEWSQVVIPAQVDADGFIVFNAYNIATDVMFTNFEIRTATEVYDTRVPQRYVDYVSKLMAEPDFAAGAEELGILDYLEILKEMIGEDPETGDDITSFIDDTFEPIFQEYINSVAGNTVSRIAKDENDNDITVASYLTSWTSWGYYNWNNMSTRGTWTFEGGRWGFSPNNESLERPADDGYVASAGIQTSYNLENVGLRIASGAFNNTSIKAGRYMFQIEAQAVAASNKAAPYGADPSVIITEPTIWLGKDTVLVENDTLNGNYWKKYYIIRDITEEDIANGLQVSAGFKFPNMANGKGGRYSLRNPEFRFIGKSQDDIDHLYAYDQLAVQQNAFKTRLDSAQKISTYTQAQGYPWGHKVLQDSIDKYSVLYADLLTVVDANGIELQPDRVTLAFKDEILAAVQNMNRAINGFYSTNRYYQTLISDIAICNTSLNADQNAAGDKATFQTVISKAQAMVDATTTDADEVDAFNAMDEELLTAKEEFEKSCASRANPANLYVKNKNLNFESWSSKSTYSSDQTVNGWEITIGADGKQWDIAPNNAYEFGHRASIWRGTSVGPNGRMKQTISITTPGVYEFRSRAFSAEYGDGAKWPEYMAIATICGAILDWDTFENAPVDTIYHPNVRLFFGELGSVNDSITLTKCAPADHLRRADGSLAYTRESPMEYSIIFIKEGSDSLTMEFGLEALENGATAGASTFGFGDNRLYYLGPKAAYETATDADYQAAVNEAKALIAQYTTADGVDPTVGWIVYKLMRYVGDTSYPWAEGSGLGYVAPTTLQEKQNVYLSLREYMQMLKYSVDPEILGIEELPAQPAVAVPARQQGTYNLNGMRMDGQQLPAGLYIINGRKVVVK